MIITTAIVTVRHDGGLHRLKVVSLSGLAGAIQQVCAMEGCPETAIIALRVIRVKRIP